MLGLLPLLIGFQLLVWIVSIRPALSGTGDFTTLYTTGYMLRTGHGAEIRDEYLLLEYKQKVTPGKSLLPLPMDHLPYEALLYAPFALLPYRAAFVCFVIINFTLLGLCWRLLKQPFQLLHKDWKLLPLLLFCAFFPVTRAILEGQDSVVLLALLSGAMVCLHSGKEHLAGTLTALGLFKLQVVLPIALMFLLWKRWRFVIGFTVWASAMLLITYLIVGLQGLRQFSVMLMNMSFLLRTEADAMRYLLSPKTMLNLRGLLSGILLGHLPHWWIQGLIVTASIVVVGIACRLRPSMPLAILVAALVSYHLNAQDAIILIIPLGIALCSDSKLQALFGAMMLVAPNIAIAPLVAFWASIPIVLLFIAEVMLAGKESSNLSYAALVCL